MHRTKPIKLIHNLHIFIGWTTYTQGDTLNQLFGTTKMENFMDELSFANSFFLWYYGTIGKAIKKYLVHLMAASKGSHPIIDFLKRMSTAAAKHLIKKSWYLSNLKLLS